MLHAIQAKEKISAADRMGHILARKPTHRNLCQTLQSLIKRSLGFSYTPVSGSSLAHYEGAFAVRLCAGHGLCGEPAAGSVPRQLGWDSHSACVHVQGELQKLCEAAEGSMLKGLLSLLCPAGCADLQMRRVCSALCAPLYCSLTGVAK